MAVCYKKLWKLLIDRELRCWRHRGIYSGKQKRKLRRCGMDSSYPYIASLAREPFLFYGMRTSEKLMYGGLDDEGIVKQKIDIAFAVDEFDFFSWTP